MRVYLEIKLVSYCFCLFNTTFYSTNGRFQQPKTVAQRFCSKDLLPLVVSGKSSLQPNSFDNSSTYWTILFSVTS